MNNDLSSYFEDPEFKEALEKYEGMVKNHTPAYFDADELTDIAEYYASKGRQIEAEAAIDFALQLHPNDTDALIFRARSLAMKGRLDEAYMVMDLIEDRSDREVRFLKADLLMEEKRMEEADHVFEELAAYEEGKLETLIDIILAYIDANQEALAKKWIKHVGETYDPFPKKARSSETYCVTFISLSIIPKRPFLFCKPHSTAIPTPSIIGTVWANAT